MIVSKPGLAFSFVWKRDQNRLRFEEPEDCNHRFFLWLCFVRVAFTRSNTCYQFYPIKRKDVVIHHAQDNAFETTNFPIGAHHEAADTIIFEAVFV